MCTLAHTGPADEWYVGLHDTITDSAFDNPRLSSSASNSVTARSNSATAASCRPAM